MVLVGHMSLKNFDIRIPRIELACFQKMGFGESLKKRKGFLLEYAAPVNIDTEEYNYTADKLIDRQIQFAYTKYTVEAEVGTEVNGASMVKQSEDALRPPTDANHPNNIIEVDGTPRLISSEAANQGLIGGDNQPAEGPEGALQDCSEPLGHRGQGPGQTGFQ